MPHLQIIIIIFARMSLFYPLVAICPGLGLARQITNSGQPLGLPKIHHFRPLCAKNTQKHPKTSQPNVRHDLTPIQWWYWWRGRWWQWCRWWGDNDDDDGDANDDDGDDGDDDKAVNFWTVFAAPYPSATSWLETSHTILDTNSLRDDDDHEDDGEDDYDEDNHDIYEERNIFNPKISFWSDISS